MGIVMSKINGRLIDMLDILRGFTTALDCGVKVSYHKELDFIEFTVDDCFVVSERIDEYLTILKDGDTREMVGFKVKGFAYIYNQYIKPKMGDVEFLSLMEVLLTLFTIIGNQQLRKKPTKDE